MNHQVKHSLSTLIPDLLPIDHEPLSTKRVRFIRGQGIILYDDQYAVEIYVPRNSSESPIFFGVHRHRGQLDHIRDQFYKLPMKSIDDSNVSHEVRETFNEGVSMFLPYPRKENQWIRPKKVMAIKGAKEIYMTTQMNGAA